MTAAQKRVNEFSAFWGFERALNRCYDHFMAANWEDGERWHEAIHRIIRAWRKGKVTQ